MRMDIGKNRLELRVPRQPTVIALAAMAPVFLAYLLSFAVVMVMWVNHHHLLHGLRLVNSKVLWFNAILLFWMSLIPFATAWLGANHQQPVPVALYGLNLACCTSAFLLLRTELARQVRHDPVLREHHAALQRKSGVTITLYSFSVGAAFVSVYLAEAIFAILPLLYLLPDKQLPARKGLSE